MKLNENLFKPIFGRMLEWVGNNPSKLANNPRAITFYHVVDKLADALKVTAPTICSPTLFLVYICALFWFYVG